MRDFSEELEVLMERRVSINLTHLFHHAKARIDASIEKFQAAFHRLDTVNFWAQMFLDILGEASTVVIALVGGLLVRGGSLTL
eukprot:1790891-Pyramimonas_sp.AAC.1